MGRPPVVDEAHRRLLEDGAMPAGALAAFAVAAVTVPFQGESAGAVVLSVMVLTVLTVALLAGRLAGAVMSVMASFSFDFFHVAPIRVLHLRTLSVTALLLSLVAVVAGRAAAHDR